MSGQSSQSTPAKMQKSSPNFGKQGPMKATIPMSSVLKPNSNLKGDSSPNDSPTQSWRSRHSPDPGYGQRSPGAYSSKVKSKSDGNGDKMRRTASLDHIYLKGHWPRDNFYWNTGTLQINKSTQTDEADLLETRKIHSLNESENKLDKYMVRPKIRGNKESNSRHGSPDTLNTSSQTLTSCILSPTFKMNPMSIPSLKPLPKSSMRSSVEGLNQEIERIVLKTCTVGSQSGTGDEEYDKFSQITPEGHRAPLAELFRSNRSRSVNTQTPSEFGESCHSSGPPSRGSYSPHAIGRFLDSPIHDTGSSQGSSPDETGKLGTSPQINRFLAREPPDGCEKVLLKSLEDRKVAPQLEHAPQPCNFKLKPSLGSAFQLLQPNSVEPDVPLVPPQDNN